MVLVSLLACVMMLMYKRGVDIRKVLMRCLVLCFCCANLVAWQAFAAVTGSISDGDWYDGDLHFKFRGGGDISGPYTTVIDEVEVTYNVNATCVSKMTEMGLCEYTTNFVVIKQGKCPGSVIALGREGIDLRIPEQIDDTVVLFVCDEAFADCRMLRSVVLPDTIPQFRPGIFSGCSSLRSVILPNELTFIPARTFDGCTHLEGIVIPKTVEFIEEAAFRGCAGIRVMTLPSSVTSIGASAFENCSGLTMMTIPEGVTTIGSRAFAGCAGLDSVTLPTSLGSIGSEALDCPAFWTEYYKRFFAAPTPASAASVTVTNVVVHYILNSPQPQFAIQPCGDAGFVNIITEVKGSAVSVPSTWALNYPTFSQLYGGDFTKALMKPTGKVSADGTPMLVWQDYVAGTDPTKEDDVFTASITIVDGEVKVSYTPELDDARKALRKYTTWGKKSLLNAGWTEVESGKEADYNFFKVTVEMK